MKNTSQYKCKKCGEDGVRDGAHDRCKKCGNAARRVAWAARWRCRKCGRGRPEVEKELFRNCCNKCWSERIPTCTKCGKQVFENEVLKGRSECRSCRDQYAQEWRKRTGVDYFKCPKCGKESPEIKKSMGRNCCNKCWTAYMVAYTKQEGPKAKIRYANMVSWQRLKSDPERMKKDRDKKRKREYVKSLASYGLTLSDFDRMLIEQAGRCAVCNVPMMIQKKNDRNRPCVDHDHSSGKARELLCLGCNLMIGYALERPEVLVAGSEYLKKYL